MIDASCLPCAVLLSIEFEDGKTLYNHIIEDTKIARENFSNFEICYKDIRSIICNIKFGNENNESDNLLKQVYFPINDSDYHLLSILYPSSSMFSLKKKIC